MTCSDEDHLLASGDDTTYELDLDGFLITKTRGTEVTRYTYSSTGELKAGDCTSILIVAVKFLNFHQT